MSIEQFNQILAKSQCNDETKEKLREFFELLNEDGQNYLIKNLESATGKSSS